MRTRVGYTGGEKPSPTYHAIGDHSEAIEIDFDPTVVSYEDLLAEFFASHNPCGGAFSTQYRSAVFPRSSEQRASAEAAAASVAKSKGQSVTTAIEDFSFFTLAEDYHQKYRLRHARVAMAEFEELFPTMEALLHSTAVTRANAFAAGYGSRELRAADLPRLGLSEAAVAAIAR